MRSFLFCILANLLIINLVIAQSEKNLVREGNDLYENGNYSEAEIKYRKALEKDPQMKAPTFNLGDTYYQQKEWQKAADQFKITAETSDDKDIKYKAYHNLGNTYLEQKNYKEAIEAYKNSLKNNPKDVDTKYNLAYAQSMLKANPPQQNQDQDKKDEDKKDDEQKEDNKDDSKKDKNKDKKDQDEKGDKDQDQQQKENQKPDEQKGDQKDQQPQQPQPREQRLSKEEAERLLEALKNEEKKLQEKMLLQQRKGQPTKTDKDW